MKVHVYTSDRAPLYKPFIHNFLYNSDINECEGTHNCQGVAMCVNTLGSFRCDCPSGYGLTVNHTACEGVLLEQLDNVYIHVLVNTCKCML